MGKHAKLKEKQKWSHEKFHLENARKMRGIYFIDPEDKDFKETIKNARRKLEKTKLACVLEADEFTRMRMGNSKHYHEDHIAGKGDNFITALHFGSEIFLMPQAMKIPAAKSAVDKEWEKLANMSAWNLTKVKSKKEVIDEARTSGAKVHFASLMDMLSEKC